MCCSPSIFLTSCRLSKSAKLLAGLRIFVQVPVKLGASQVALVVKNLLANAEVKRCRFSSSLGREDPPEEGMATHSSILAWRIHMDRGAWRVTVHGVVKSDRTEAT